MYVISFLILFLVLYILVNVRVTLKKQENKKDNRKKILWNSIGIFFVVMLMFSNLNVLPDNTKNQEINAVYKKEDQRLKKQFSEDPQAIISEINLLIKEKKWVEVKNKTEILLKRQNSEIQRMYYLALTELDKIETEKQKTLQQQLDKQAKERAAELWSYSQNDDLMSNGKTYYASISSENLVNFDFPYSGPQKGKLTLRTHPKHGKDIIFSIQRGQLLCSSYQGCKVLVRFDDEEARSYSASAPADNSTETLFINNYSQFAGKLMKAKRLRISVNVYQEGSPVFEFDVSGFQVDKYKPK